MIKNKDRKLVTAPRVLGRRHSASRSVSVQHSHVTLRTCVDGERATRPNSVMGTTSADYPLAVRPAGPCWRPPQVRGLRCGVCACHQPESSRSRGRGAVSARRPRASRCRGEGGPASKQRPLADAGVVTFTALRPEPSPRCHRGEVSPWSRRRRHPGPGRGGDGQRWLMS